MDVDRAIAMQILGRYAYDKALLEEALQNAAEENQRLRELIAEHQPAEPGGEAERNDGA